MDWTEHINLMILVPTTAYLRNIKGYNKKERDYRGREVIS